MASDKHDSGVYVFEPTKNNEIDLENIDEELRMEQVRQAGTKVEWATLGQIVRRNLQEKRNTLDADGRIDVLNGIAFMKTRLPIDATSPLDEKLKIFSESLGMAYEKYHDEEWYIYDAKDRPFQLCFTTNGTANIVLLVLWGEPQFESPTALKMLKEGKWTELRDMIQRLLDVYDRSFDFYTRNVCIDGMRMLEGLLNRASTDNSYAAINGSPHGYYLPRDDLRAGRVYYFATPFYRAVKANNNVFHLENGDWDQLPYFEISFIKHDEMCSFPEYREDGEWNETSYANAAVHLKLSRGIVVSKSTRRKLAMFTAKAATVKHYINSYRYLSQAVRITDSKLITQWPNQDTQQLYRIVGTFDDEGDSVITEIFLKRVQDLYKVIDILRREQMHMYLWESVLSGCCERPKLQEHVEKAIPISLVMTRPKITLVFYTKTTPITIKITDNDCAGWNVQIQNSNTELSISNGLDEIASRKLNEHWSIPLMLAHIVKAEDCYLSEVVVPLKAKT